MVELPTRVAPAVDTLVLGGCAAMRQVFSGSLVRLVTFRCFHEGSDPVASNAFRQMAKVSGGAYAPFDSSAAETLRDLLRAVAVFAAGGRAALAALPGATAARIAGQLPGPKAAR